MEHSLFDSFCCLTIDEVRLIFHVVIIFYIFWIQVKQKAKTVPDTRNHYKMLQKPSDKPLKNQS